MTTAFEKDPLACPPYVYSNLKPKPISHINIYPYILLDKLSIIHYDAIMDATKGKFLTTPDFNQAFASLAQCVACINLWFHSTPRTHLFIMYHTIDKAYFVVPQKAINREAKADAFKERMIVFQGSLAMLRDIARGFPIDLFASNIENTVETT